MRIFKKISGGGTLVLSLMLGAGLVGIIVVYAATTPSLGDAASYAVLASTYINTSAATTITGDVGFTTGPAASPLGVHANYGSGAPYSTAGDDQATALSTLNAQTCDFTFGSATDLSLESQPLASGVYCITGAASIGTGGITLAGAGTYIFRSTGAFTTVDNSIVDLNGASACNVFWTPGAATTLGATTTFAGSVIQATSSAITTGANTTWAGRALAFGGTVTTGATTTITAPACAPVEGTINVVKTVVNDNGRLKSTSDFPIFVNGTLVVSGVTNTFSLGTYTVTETGDSNYTQTFSGDCSANGTVDLTAGGHKFCIITNDDTAIPSGGGGGGGFIAPVIPPIIDVVKVPNPLALPGGPGSVAYTYTLNNIGTVPVTNITMVGDTCSPIVLASGDSNANATLEVDETWVYTCSTTLSETHTNTIVATGWANGLSAVDIASATVVVGVPVVVPPLIHITKVPNPLTLLAGGGMVTYTKTVTNPGTVALSNVRLTDDKCAPVIYGSGDTNSDSKLDASESWTYTCQTNLTKTTTNTAVAAGDANGLTARDFAIVTVVVAPIVPGLPNTGIAPDKKNMLQDVVLPAGILALAIAFFIRRKQTA